MCPIRNNRSAFTLIELLIVVAIIAILAAIAVPNFLEAQVRAKVSRVKTDMRSIAVAIESYTVDWNRGPIGYNEGSELLKLWDAVTRHWAFNRMTSPIAYLSSPARDPFAVPVTVRDTAGNVTKSLDYYEYQHCEYWLTGTNVNRRIFASKGYVWYLRSLGPDGVIGSPMLTEMVAAGNPNNVYDPSNGTVSNGEIHLTSKGFFTGPSS
ncbi:prepilin-type N-terminal cleavage/methylation domain-containing protein [Candidatus Sumerlaeota bacterium]|nr:prepilin-type N-terminal cleavage/methylation domain-containing protein [Candidatus Sumerlaeota bacterium]